MRKRKRKYHKKKYQQTERLKERNKKRIRVGVKDEMKIPEESKTKNNDSSEICIQRRYKIKNEEIKKIKKIYEKLERGISQEYSSSYQQATAQAKKLLLLKQKQKHYSY